MAQSQCSKDIETQAARQAMHIKWCNTHHIPNPCGSDVGYKQLVALFIKNVMVGQANYYSLEEGLASKARGR